MMVPDRCIDSFWIGFVVEALLTVRFAIFFWLAGKVLRLEKVTFWRSIAIWLIIWIPVMLAIQKYSAYLYNFDPACAQTLSTWLPWIVIPFVAKLICKESSKNIIKVCLLTYAISFTA